LVSQGAVWAVTLLLLVVAESAYCIPSCAACDKDVQCDRVNDCPNPNGQLRLSATEFQGHGGSGNCKGGSSKCKVGTGFISKHTLNQCQLGWSGIDTTGHHVLSSV